MRNAFYYWVSINKILTENINQSRKKHVVHVVSKKANLNKTEQHKT